MYGLVNQSLLDFSRSAYPGFDLPREMEEAGLVPGEGFDPFQSYDDEVTLGLIGHIVARTQCDLADLLRRFGIFWLSETASCHYAELLELAGSDIESFLGSLNSLHDRAHGIFPGYRPPSFRTEGSLAGNDFEVYYSSHREGLAPFVVGLLQGVVLRFDADHVVAHTGTTPSGEEVFTLRKPVSP